LPGLRKILHAAEAVAEAPARRPASEQTFYKMKPSGWTPLREALSRVGRHYGGIKTGINDGMNEDPVQYSCQANIALLTTDGYWNTNAGQRLDGSAIGDVDNVDSGFSTRAVGAYDGNIGASDSLADVAMYLLPDRSAAGRLYRVRSAPTSARTTCRPPPRTRIPPSTWSPSPSGSAWTAS
jgi:hypothetical protein